MGFDIGDKASTLFKGLSGFWQRFFRDTQDLEAYYQASEVYLGQVYLDLMGAVLNVGLVDTPIFNKEYWRLFLIDETEVHFREGPSVAEDRFVYDMPGSTVTVDFLQNSIFDPDVLYERDVDFEVENNDGYARFHDDPFKGTQNTSGEWMPRAGIGWRTLSKEVGNQFTDQARTGNWDDDSDVKRGDILRLLAHTGPLVQSGGGGSMVSGTPNIFSSVALNDLLCQEGDILQIHGTVAPDLAYSGIYVMGRQTWANMVEIEPTFYVPTFNSTTALSWRHYRGVYFSTPRDYEVDYFDTTNIVGSVANPYPLDITAPIVYAVVRQPYAGKIIGATILPAPETIFGYKHLVPGSVKVYATVNTVPVRPAEENVDYTIDYLHGRLHQINFATFPLQGVMTCTYSYYREVLYSAGGVIAAKDVGRVKQISLWAPETLVDLFTLYYNYGSLLNRFQVSSDVYKTFLQGIIHLYVMGPALERIEAALNVAAGYPIVKTEGEILAGYDNGEIYSAADGIVTAVTSYFNSPSYTFTELDVGGQIVFPNPVHDFNKGHFRILNVIDANTVELESEYGFVDEGLVPPLMSWVLTHTYQKTVTTNLNTYKFPYNVPMRTDVMDTAQVGHLILHAFDALTVGFTVTDYVEDPRWWHNKYIPAILYGDTLQRRYATTQLYENVIGPPDDLRIGDPGYFIGADDEGNVFTPDDNLGNPVNLHRHSTAFILFDRYLKCHMFYVDFSSDLALTSAFTKDLEELILVSKPSYTYPYVEPGTQFTELATLYEDFLIPKITFYWEDTTDSPDNWLNIGDTDFPWNMGGYYRYIDYSGSVAGTAGVIDPTTPFILPVSAFVPPVPGPMVLEQRLVDAVFNATVGGDPVLEGRDYRIQWLADEVDAWTVYPLTTWDALGVDLTVNLILVEYDNVAYTATPDTCVGFTPLSIGGLNPAYVRRGALDPNSIEIANDWALVRTQFVDRALSLRIDANFPGSVPYTYL